MSIGAVANKREAFRKSSDICKELPYTEQFRITVKYFIRILVTPTQVVWSRKWILGEVSISRQRQLKLRYLVECIYHFDYLSPVLFLCYEVVLCAGSVLSQQESIRVAVQSDNP